MWRKVPPEHVVASSGVGVEVAGVAEEKEEEEHEKKEQRWFIEDELTGEAHATLDCAFPQKREREKRGGGNPRRRFENRCAARRNR